MRTDTSWTGYLLDTQIQENPLSFIRSGWYDYSAGGIDYRSFGGYYWQSGVRSNTRAEYLIFNNAGLSVQGSNNKSYGFQFRCLVR